MKRIKIIGENYPEVGEKFYWKDCDGEMHDDICLKIEKDPDGNVETNYFTYIDENGGGIFVNESALVNPLDMAIRVYEEKKAKSKVKEISQYLSQEEVRSILYSKLRKNWYDEDTASHILDILSDYEN